MHSIDYRVYYEDTDAQGVVYYANYLKFCERARTEYLRSLGYEQKELMDIGIIFIVRKVIIEYLKPVKLDELIKIQTCLKKLRKSVLTFHKQFTILIQRRFVKQRYFVVRFILYQKNLCLYLRSF